MPRRKEIEASVVIPTRNRSELLGRVLESFTSQSADRRDFEVVVVDDGSTDDTEATWQAYADRLDTRYVRIDGTGLAAAKNAGIEAARGRLIVFADDDDVAGPELVAEHIRVHKANPEKELGVLGFTTWDPALPVTELMHFVTEVGQFLWSYRPLRHGDVLDFRYCWGGRVSLKRELLVAGGRFDERMTWLEDMEHSYRLSALGLRILFTRRAVTYMLRSFDYDGFCQRCERVGRGLARFQALHAGPVADEYEALLLGARTQALAAVDAGSLGRHEAVTDAKKRLEALRPEVLHLEARLAASRLGFRSLLGRLSPERRRLYGLYDDSFRTAMLQGALAGGDNGG